jgi:hypothetical protein
MERRIKKLDQLLPSTMMTVDQAANEFQLRGTTRMHILKKFKAAVWSVNDWNRIFHKEKVV